VPLYTATTNYSTTATINCGTGGSTLNTYVWPAWNATYTQTAITTGTAVTSSVTMPSNDLIWTAWNTNSAACTTGTNHYNNDWTIHYTQRLDGLAWEALNDRYETIREAGAEAERIRRYSRRQLTEEELVAELNREKRLREEAETRARVAREAQERAEHLLMTCLSPKQKEDLKQKNCFYIEVPTSDGKMERYRVDRGTHGNVKQLDAKGSIIRSFCVQPNGVPVADSMLTQKLFLEADEETRAKFWETANISEVNHVKAIPAHIPRQQRREYARQHGLLH
jgi:hypothetical protein